MPWSKFNWDESTVGPASDTVDGLLQKLHFLAKRDQLPPCRSRQLQCEIASAKEHSHAVSALREVEKSFFPQLASESLSGAGLTGAGEFETDPTSMSLPTVEEYPNAPKDLFTPETVSNGIHNL